jgi:glutathione S-transferase
MLTIHGTPFSPFVRKVLVLLAEKGVDFDVKIIDEFPGL